MDIPIIVMDSKIVADAPLAKKSSPEVWEKRAKLFFDQQNFRQAKMCYFRAGNNDLADNCSGIYLLALLSLILLLF